MHQRLDEHAAAAKILEPVKDGLSTPGRLMYGDCLMRMGLVAGALS